MLSKDVYDGPRFKNIKDLKTKITNTIYQFYSMKREDLKVLYVTTRQRLCTVLFKNGIKNMSLRNFIVIRNVFVKNSGNFNFTSLEKIKHYLNK